MEFIHIDGEERPKILITPYIYAIVIECSLHYMIYEKGKPKIIDKKRKEYYLED